MTSPYLICYPQHAKDIKSALKYAVSNNKKVTVRSGGHQYSGKSSGGDDTIVIDLGTLKYFNKVYEINDNLITVEPGVRL